MPTRPPGVVQQLGGSVGTAVLAVMLGHQLLAHVAAPDHAFDPAFW